MSHNYWGTSDMGSARSRVSDFFIDPLKSVSNISPFYSSDPVLNHSAILVMRNSIAYFLDKDGFVGGKLQQSLAIPMDTSLKVKRNIWVLHGKRLRIESGAHLQFWKSTGIFAESKMIFLLLVILWLETKTTKHFKSNFVYFDELSQINVLHQHQSLSK